MISRLKSHIEEWTFKNYVALSLQNAPQGKYLVATYEELVRPKPVDTRKGEEIINDVFENCGLKWSEKNEQDI